MNIIGYAYLPETEFKNGHSADSCGILSHKFPQKVFGRGAQLGEFIYGSAGWINACGS